MWVTIILLCLATSAYARPEIIRPDEDAVELQALAQPDPKELQDFIEAEAQPDELNRKKKQITTFCVEIRPSDHKPFQVCEPYRQKEYYPNQHHQHQHAGGDNHIKPQSGHSGGGSHVKPAFSTPIKTYAPSESSRPPPKQSFEGFQQNFPQVQNVGPARAASEDEMQIENEIPSHGAAKANQEELKFFDVPVPVRSAFEEENDLDENEIPSMSSPARSASNAEPMPVELNKEDTPVDEPIHEAVNEAPKDIGKAIKPSDENLREAVKDDIQEEVKSEVKSDVTEVKPDIKEVESDIKGEINSDTKGEINSDNKVVDKDVKVKDPTHIRAAEQSDAYKPKPAYGHPTQYLPYSPIHQNHHSGLVITCQPNLAGYAHRVPDPYPHQGGYHSGGHSPYNHRAADPTFGRPHYRPQAQYGNYGGYKPYQPYRPQAQHYQGPAYPYPQPYHKAIQTHKPEIHKMDPYKQEQHYQPQEQHYQPPHQSYQYYPYAPAYPQQPYYKPSQGFGHKTEEKGEHHLRSSDVLERANERDEQTSFEEETKEQHTLKKMEDISKQRLAESWVPEGMEEVFVGQPREVAPVSEHDHLSNVGDKSLEEKKSLNHNIDANEAEEGGQRSADHDTPAGGYIHSSHNIDAKEAEDEENQRLPSFDHPESENIHPGDQVNVKEADEESLRSPSFDHPESDFGHPEDNVHIHHNGDPKEIDDGEWRSASSIESDTSHFIHNNGANEAVNGPWRSARPPVDDHLHHVDIQEEEGGGWRSANHDSPGVEHMHHNVEAKSAENGGWRSANHDTPNSHQVHPGPNDPSVSDHVHPTHTGGAKSAENGGWRSAGYPAVNDHVHPMHNGHPPVSDLVDPMHNDGAKSAENGGWRSAGYPAVNDHVHPGHIGGAKSAENGGWRSAGYPAVSDHVHPDHIGGAKSAENGGWRSAGYPAVSDHVNPSHNGHPPASDLVHLSHNGGAKSAENGGWRIVDDGFPGGEGDLTHDEGLREAQGENVDDTPNGNMKNIQEDAFRDAVENGSLENKIVEES